MKKIYISLLLASILVITFVSMNLVSAISLTATNLTFRAPVATDAISGNYAANLTIISGYEAQNWTKLFVYCISALTANTTVTKGTLTPGPSSNGTRLDFNVTLPTKGVIEDGSDYTLTFMLFNGTDNVNKTVAIAVDNTIPTTPTLSPATGTTDSDGTINFTGTVGGANTTACTLYFDGTNPGNPSYSMTHAGSSCGHQLTGIPEGTYKWYIANSDGTNTTNSASVEVSIDTTNSKTGIYGGDITTDQSGFVVGEQTQTPNWIVPLIVVIAIIGIGYWIARRK